jgi:hypothetical protein
VNQEPIDRRCDVFAAGIVLHELLTGKRLFGTKSELETLRRVSAAEAQPPSRINHDVPPALDAIVMRALSRRCEDRYDSGTEMAAALEGLQLSLAREQLAELIDQIFPGGGVEGPVYFDPAELEDTENGDVDAGAIESVTSPDRVHSAPHLVLVSSELLAIDEEHETGSVSRTGRDVEIEALSSGSFEPPSVRAAAVASALAPPESDKAFANEPTRAAPIEEVRPTRIYDPTKAPERSGAIDQLPAKPPGADREFDAQPTSVYVSDELLPTPAIVHRPEPAETPPGIVVSPSLSVLLDPAPASRSGETPAPVLTGDMRVEDREQTASPLFELEPTRMRHGSRARSVRAELPRSGPRRKRRAWPLAIGALLVVIGFAGLFVGRAIRRSSFRVYSVPPTAAKPRAIELAAPTPAEPRLPTPEPTPNGAGGSLADRDRSLGNAAKVANEDHSASASAAGPKAQNQRRTPSTPTALSSPPPVPKHAPKRQPTVKEGRIVDPFADDG